MTATNLFPVQPPLARQTTDEEKADYELFKETVSAWFDKREVCDDDNFPDFFRRVIVRDYGRYYELLRIEPGYAQFDWLVEEYLELQRKSSGITSNIHNAFSSNAQKGKNTGASSTASKGTDRNSESGTEQAQSSTIGTTSNESVKASLNNESGNEKASDNESASKSNIVKDLSKSSEQSDDVKAQITNDQKASSGSETKSGQDGSTDKTSGSDEEHHTSNMASNYDLDEYNTSYTDTDTHTPSGYKEIQRTTLHQGSKDVQQTLKRQGTASVDTQMAKAQAQSMTYAAASGGAVTGTTGTITESGAVSGGGVNLGNDLPSASWQTPSTQGQTVSKSGPIGNAPDLQVSVHTIEGTSPDEVVNSYEGSDINTKKHEDGPGSNEKHSHAIDETNLTTKDATTTHSGTNSETGSNKEEENASAASSESASHKGLNEEQKQEAGEEAGATIAEHNKASKGASSASESGTENGKSEEQQSSQSGHLSNGLTEHDNSQTSANNGTTESQVQDTQSATDNGQSSNVDEEIHTGRHGEIAGILSQASDYIKASSAWAWMAKRLEPCFMGVYDV